MSKLAYISHPIYYEHDTGPGHPERPDRVTAVEEKVNKGQLRNKLDLIASHPAGEADILLNHSDGYLVSVKQAISHGRRLLDMGDTVAGPRSYDAALYASGAAITGINLLLDGGFNRVFAAVRPPGHHAEYDHASGFCIFNNIAIGARYAQQKGLAKKILIVDFDVHHGNGTQHSFEYDASVFYYSLHQYPFFPGTGAASEIGKEQGEGYTLNRPLPGGTDDNTCVSAFEKDLIEIESRFEADLVLISAGFDGHKNDPLGGMILTENAYWKITEILSRYAWKHSEGKILSVLEGGYNLNALASCVEAHLDSLIKH